MKAKLVKVVIGDEYRLDDENGLLIASSLYSSKNKLSLKNCQAIERGYDLDELFDEVDESIDYHEFDFTSFRLGFQKALELMSDKKFSEEDVISMIEKSRETGLTAEYLILTKQQTEWDVEIEMEDIFVKNNEQYVDEVGIGNYSTHSKKPKLDSDGCLILKRI